MLKKLIESKGSENISKLNIIPEARLFMDDFDEGVEEQCGRFIGMAAHLPAGEYLGMVFNDVAGGGLESLAFSGPASGIGESDFEWIFKGYAEVLKSEAGTCRNFFSDMKNFCVICEKKDSTDIRHYVSTGRYTDILDNIKNTGARMIVLAKSCGNNRDVSGYLFLCSPEAASMRLKTSISLAFEGAEFTEADKTRYSGIKINGFNTDNTKRIVVSLMEGAAIEDKKAKEAEKRAKEKLEQDEGYEDMTPIEALDLNVRSYNCLKRAGVDHIGKLQKMTADELRKIRNLTRSCLEEIQTKLSEYNEKESCESCKPVQKKPTDYSKMLDQLIGLEAAKARVRKIEAFAKMKRDMKEKSKNEPDIPVVLNMEFVGNPGTAKTTVARILAGILKEAGIIRDSKPVEVGRADLVAEYVGQTAEKVKSIFESAEGKMIFIDEAYSLVDDRKGSFGDEAINTIVQEMDNRRETTVVVFAGYPDKMKELFSRNPGLRSRVPFTVSFKDYCPEEMVRIAVLEAKKRGFAISPKGKEKILESCRAAINNNESGNGRFCRNLIEGAILNYAERVYGSGDSEVKRFVLTAADIDSVTPRKNEAKVIGFKGAA